MPPVEQTYFRRGFGLKGRIEGALTADYHSHVVDRIREHGYVLALGDLTFKLAGEFGFCYGVDRAVEYAYETRTKFPDKRIFLVGEIITGRYTQGETTPPRSEVTKSAGGPSLVVGDMARARDVCDYSESGGSGEGFLQSFAGRVPPGCAPDRALVLFGPLARGGLRL